MIEKRRLQFMDWNECGKEFIREVEVDNEKIKSLIKLSLNRFNFIKSIDVNSSNVSFIVENYYEVIKELLIALLLKNGLKSQNHQCLITYFYKNYQGYEFQANLILQMSYLRNRLEYYGESIDLGFYNKYKEDFVSIIELIKNLIEK